MNNYCPIPGASQPKEPVRLIDANELLKHFNTNDCAFDGDEFQAYKNCMMYVRDLVEDAPTIDPESLRPTAHWIVTKINVCEINRYECSSCGAVRYKASALHLNYCQACGKRMVNADD